MIDLRKLYVSMEESRMDRAIKTLRSLRSRRAKGKTEEKSEKPKPNEKPRQ